ncbi:MAG: sugar transferase [Bythopirellula sp.]|nr:sugar transferase [Bythopirellula sp.]
MTRLATLLERLSNGLGRSSGRKSHNTHDSLLSVNRLLFFLERARFQANRSDAPFCLLALTITPSDCDGKGVHVLAGILHERLRITDDKGYLEDGRIGVILPDTPEAGAHVVARDICTKYQALGGTISYEVYVYPSDFDLEGNPIFEDEEENVGTAASSGLTARPMQTLFAANLPLWKRAIDLTVSSFLLIVLSPVFLIAALLIKLSSPGPALFVQQRAGLGGKPFPIFKFRTMRVGADAEKALLREFSEQDGPAFKLANDPRVTRIGQLLRTTSIDELPQLLNVLWGNMSLVGPRPLPVEESQECEPWHRYRLDVTPGITCIWQVTGRSSVTFAEWVRMDIEYIQSVSLFQDVKLLLLTIPSVLFCKGAR